MSMLLCVRKSIQTSNLLFWGDRVTWSIFLVIDLCHVTRKLRKCDDNDGFVVIRREQKKRPGDIFVFSGVSGSYAGNILIKMIQH